jgi:hypothetical protein
MTTVAAPAAPQITPQQMHNKTVTFTIEGYDFVEEEVSAVLHAVNMTMLAYTPIEGEEDAISVIAMTDEPITANTSNTTSSTTATNTNQTSNQLIF